MPGSGGTYLYLRKAFRYRTGNLMPFLFIWTAMLFIPLIMSTGVIGLVSYLGFFLPALVGVAGSPDRPRASPPWSSWPCTGGSSGSRCSPPCCGW